MTCRLIVSNRAETDLKEAFLWYEQRSVGLGYDFLHCVEAKLVVITQAPRLFRKRSGPHRLALTDRFPYAIYFIWNEDRQIVSVRRVLHFRQESRPSGEEKY